MSAGFRLRITYAIRGRLAYLSHLETVEAMRRIVRRSQLPYAVTQGFSPHMKVSLGPALPVGASGEEERFDVWLSEYVAPLQALSRLQAASPAHLVPRSVEYVDVGAPALDVAFCISIWHAFLWVRKNDDTPCEQPGQSQDELACACTALSDAIDALLMQGHIEVVKKKRAKTSVKQVEFEGRLLEVKPPRVEDGRVGLCFSTHQGKEGALRPDLFVDAACSFLLETSCSVGLYSLVRERLCESAGS